MKGRHLLWVGLALVVGLALRLAAMHERVLLDDEVGTALGAGRSYGEIISSFQSWMTQPATIALARLSGELLGPSELAFRLPSLFFGLLGIVAVWLLGRHLGGERVGVLAALLLALHPYHLFYSQMARGYVMTATLATLSIWFLLRVIDKPGWVGTLGLGICTLLLGAAHLASLTLVFGEILILAASCCQRRHRDARATIIKWAVPALGVAMVALLLLYRPMFTEIVGYTRDTWGSRAGGFSLGFVPLGLEAYMGGRGLSIYIYALVGFIGWVCLSRADPRTGLALPGWPLGLLLLLWLLDSGHYPWSFSRFFFFALPALVIAAAAGLDRIMGALRRRLRGREPIVGLALALFLGLTSIKSLDIAFGEKDPYWPELLSDLRGQAPEDALLVSVPVRFNSLYIYQQDARCLEMVELPGLVKLLMDERPGRLRRKLVYLVDLVPLERPGLVGSRQGIVSVIHRPWGRPADEEENLRDLEAILTRTIAYLEEPPCCCLEDGWVYWRIAPRHEHLCVARDSLTQAYAALALVEGRLGDPDASQTARERVAHYLREPLRPGEVTASWSILAPHLDGSGFLAAHTSAGTVKGAR